MIALVRLLRRRVRGPAFVLALAVLVACGPGARDKALRGSLLAVDASAAAFVTYNRDHQRRIVEEAATYDDGLSRLNAWHQEREPVLDGIRLAYRLIALATLDKDASLADVLRAVRELDADVAKLTGGGP